MDRVGRLASWIILQRSWHRYLVALFLGLVSALALPPLDLIFVLFFTFPGMVWVMDGLYGDNHEGLKSQIFAAFAPGWWFGFGYFTGGLWWIGNALLVEASIFAWALPFAVFALPALLAVFWGIATIIARILWSDGWGRVFALAAGLALAEFLRGTLFTGLPWNSIGYLAMPSPVLMQSASFIGVYGMGAIALIIFALPLTGLLQAHRAGKNFSQTLYSAPVIIAIIMFMIHIGIGSVRMYANPTSYESDVQLRIMQPAIAQTDKLAIGNEAQIVQTHLDTSTLSDRNDNGSTADLQGIDYLIWPESAFPFLLTEAPQVLASIADLLPEGTKLITGAMRAEPGAAGNPYGKVYNSVFIISDKGEIQAAADKTHLVPFGEYLPFQSFLESIGLRQISRIMRGGFASGVQRSILQSDASHPFLPLICYEIIFSNQIFANTNKPYENVKWIVNLTNDAWFGQTPGPYQHLRQAQLRAVEEGIPVVRAANTGISAVIDPYGRVVKYLPIGARNSIDSSLPSISATTYFVHWRSYGFTVTILLCCVISLIFRKNSTS